jgi:protein required for attachment to host cells
MVDVSWIVVADSDRARIYINNYAAEKKLNLVRDYSEKDLHKKSSDLVPNDQQDFGAGSSVESSNPKYLHHNLFANALAKKLEHFRTDHKFQSLMLVAPPAFLGLLRDHLSKELTKILVTVEKDYTHEHKILTKPDRKTWIKCVTIAIPLVFDCVSF